MMVEVPDIGKFSGKIGEITREITGAITRGITGRAITGGAFNNLPRTSKQLKIITVVFMAVVIFGGGVGSFLMAIHSAPAAETVETGEAGSPMPDTVVFAVDLEDEDGNITELSAAAIVFDIVEEVVIEAGTDIRRIVALDFLVKDERQTGVQTGVQTGMYEMITMSLEKGIDQHQANTVGRYEVSILLNDIIYASYIKVIDTIPPIAQPNDVEVWLGKTAEPLDFVRNARDRSEFSARFEQVPDFKTEGKREVTVVLEDVWGNASKFTSTLTVTRDRIPPEIRGAVNRTVYVGATVMYRSGVSAWDNADGDIGFDVDSSAVNINVVGSYPVTYSAVDSSGNRRTVTVTITVTVYTPTTVYTLADNVLSRIVDASMSQTEKARAIHRWVKGNIRYSGSAERDRLSAAQTGLQNRYGDCYTYYAVSSLLLERAGIRNIQIRRTPGIRSTNHYWNLVQIGGVWYHFDATPNRFGFAGFMFTADEALRISALGGVSVNYYTYDPSLYPPIAGALPGTPSAPEIEEPDQSQSETVEPDTGEPGTDGADATEPGTSEPGTSESGISEPGTDEPGTSEPGTNEPGISEPDNTEPVSDEPDTAGSGAGDPVNTESTGTQPVG